jgi:hypothetical protein
VAGTPAIKPDSSLGPLSEQFSRLANWIETAHRRLDHLGLLAWLRFTEYSYRLRLTIDYLAAWYVLVVTRNS